MARALRTHLEGLSQTVEQAKREYSMSEHAISTARDARHAANVALARASAQFHNARLTARMQRKEEDSMKDRTQDTKMSQQHTKADLRFSQQQVSKLSDMAHQMEKEAVGSKVDSDIDVKKATAELTRRDDQLAMAKEVLQSAQKASIENQGKRQKEAYEARKVRGRQH